MNGSNRWGLALLGAVILPLAATGIAQPPEANGNIVVSALRADGPEIKGIISARSGERIKVTTPDGTSTPILLSDATRIRAGAGLFGGRPASADALVDGLAVDVRTARPTGGTGDLLAARISFSNRDMRFASMIRHGTSQRFDEQAAATESLRGRMGDIDKYNVKATTNVHFATGRTELSAQDKADLCSTASTADRTENALLLVVGYTDATGGDDLNQTLSEKRANRVINYLQQACGWKPYRMLTPTGMAKADPVASNATPQGKAQNRRVAVNILVSKSVDGF